MLQIILPLIILGFVLLVGAIVLLITTKKANSPDMKNNESNKSKRSSESLANPYKASNANNVHKEDIFKFMEFDKNNGWYDRSK